MADDTKGSDAGSAADAALAAAKAAIASLGDLTSGVSSAAGVASDAGESSGDSAAMPEGGAVFTPPTFSDIGAGTDPKTIDLLSDVNLNVKIELGRTRMLVDDVLRLGPGTVVELDKLAGDPVDVYVNDRHIARGEVLVVNDNFCVRINEILNIRKESAKAG